MDFLKVLFDGSIEFSKERANFNVSVINKGFFREISLKKVDF